MTYIEFFGTSAAVASANRGFACIGVYNDSEANSSIALLDCGDGSVRRIIQSGQSVVSIADILITHFHSDHLSGLAQIIESMAIGKRQRDLNVYGPKGLVEYYSAVQKATNVASRQLFEIKLNEIEQSQSFSIQNWKVRTFEMDHTIPCLGYRLESAGNSPRVVIAYTGDTEPCEGSEALAEDVDLLVHEATYLSEQSDKAREAKHSVPSEAGRTARNSGAKKLVLTHVNDDWETPEAMLREAKPVHSDVSVAYDGLKISLE
jgi:ribonuclease Z